MYRSLVDSQRYTFNRGQYIQYRGTQFARIDQIFTHAVIAGVQRLFIQIHPLDDCQRADVATMLPVYSITDRLDIIGVSCIVPQRTYAVPLKRVERVVGFGDRVVLQADSGDEVVVVHWDIEFM
jgi:hypothetical protein